MINGLLRDGRVCKVLGSKVLGTRFLEARFLEARFLEAGSWKRACSLA
jgi:hypothetical protein